MQFSTRGLPRSINSRLEAARLSAVGATPKPSRRSRTRRKEPALPRPYRVPGYPIVPFLFVATAGAIVVNTLIATPRESTIGLAFIALGVPVYWAFKGRGRAA